MRNEYFVIIKIVNKLLIVSWQITLHSYFSLTYVVHHNREILLAWLTDCSPLDGFNRWKIVILMRMNGSFLLSLHPYFLISLRKRNRLNMCIFPWFLLIFFKLLQLHVYVCALVIVFETNGFFVFGIVKKSCGNVGLS